MSDNTPRNPGNSDNPEHNDPALGSAGTGDYLPDTPLANTANSAESLGSGNVPMSTVPPAAALQGEVSDLDRADGVPAASILASTSLDRTGMAEPETDTKVTNKVALIIKRLLRNKGAVLGLLVLLLITLFALFGNTGRPFTYHDQDLLNLGSPPGVDGHILGTNSGGIDLWAMLVHGTGKSLLIALCVGVGAPLIAAVYGTAIAFWGGKREKVGMWFLDMLILMPYFLIVAVFMSSTGGTSLQLALLLTAFGWMGLARVIRATTASLREREFVRAAGFMGVSDWNIIRRHIIPNIGSLLIINIITSTYGAIIAETALSFLGVGVRPPDVSLGSLIGQSASQLYAYPWMFWGPSLCLVAITFSLALIGDGLRDALDPNSKSGGRA